MIDNVITFRVKEDKLDALKALYAEHFAHLRAERQRIESYEVWQDKKEPTRILTLKRFRTRADEQAHHGSPGLREFVGQLGALCSEGADFREVELLDAL